MIKKLFKKYKNMSVVAKSALWFVACTLLQKCIAFVTVPIFTRLMSTEEYGLYSTYLSWYSVLTVFCTLNMHSVIYVNQYTKASTEQEKNDVAIPLLSLSEVLTIAIFLIYVITHRYLDDLIGLPFAMVCLLFAQILFEPPVNFWSMKQRFDFRYIIMVVRTISMVVLNAGLGILFVYLSDTNQALARAFSIVIVQVIFGGIMYVYFIKRAKRVFSCKGWKHALNVQLPLLPHSLSLTVLSSSDRIMISNIVGAAEAGVYSVAYSAGYVVTVLKNSIIDALKPWIYQKIREKDFASIRSTINIVMVLVTMISIVFTAFAPEIIYIMAPSQYHDAIYVIPPVAASSFFTFLYNIFSIIGLYYEKTKKIMWASVAGAVMNIILNMICIPLFGFIAAGFTTLTCFIFFSVAHYYIMKSICKERLGGVQIYDIRFMLLMAGIVLFTTVLFELVYQHTIIRIGIVFLVIIIAFIKRKVFIKTLKDLKKNEKEV